LVEGAWLHEGAKLEFARALGEIAADLWLQNKLKLTDDESPEGIKPERPKPLSKLDAALRAFDASRSAERLEPLMKSIGEAIERASAHVDSLPDNVRLASANSIIEDLLGCAFVACQAHMNAVLQRVEAIDRILRASKRTKRTVLGEAEAVFELLERPSPRLVGPYTLTQLIWALADYHHSRRGWPPNWTNARGKTKETIAIVSAAGVEQTSSANLQTAATTLGVPSHAKLELFSYICEHWGNQLATEVRSVIGVR
jgi:hypothetical protein